MKAFVTGAAGFIGSNLVDRLLQQGWSVTGWDNLSTGRERFLAEALKNPSFALVRGDTLDQTGMSAAMRGSDVVFHLAANADVRFGLEHPDKDLQQNTIATFHVLEAMRGAGVRRIVFSSTGSVYGESPVIPTPENAPFPIQTSLYGASKLAGEGMISAYAEGFGYEATIFRFVSILGQRYTHGHVFDFCKQLAAHPEYLEVLGDGTQRKSYLHVDDCVSAILHVVERRSREAGKGAEIYNLGTAEFCTVRDSIGWICGRLGVQPELRFAGGNRGWVGDNPFIFLETEKIRGTGWKPGYTIQAGVESTVEYLQREPWVFEAR